MPVSDGAKRATDQKDEALAQEFAEYIGIVSDSIVRSQFKYDFSAIEQLARTAKEELAPIRETAQLSAKIVNALNDVQSRIQEIPELSQALLQRFIDNLQNLQRHAFEKNTGSSLQKLSSAIDRLIKELHNETSRYLEGISQAPVAMAELGEKISRTIEGSANAINDATRKVSAATESKLRSFVEDKSSVTKEEIAACSKGIEQARSQIQIELRSKTDRIITEISDAGKSVRADLGALTSGLKDEIAQLQKQVLATIQESDAKNRELFDRQSGRIGKMVEQMDQTDRRMLEMQKWIWGFGCSCLIALIILLFRALR